MKKLHILLAAALCGAMLSAVSAHAQPAMQGYATVVRAIGQCSYSLGDNVWHPLQAGKYLPVGASIRTGHNGIADVILGKQVDLPQATWQPDRISFAPDEPVRGMINYKPASEQNVIRVTPNSTITVDKLTITDTGADTVSDTELNLKEGKIYASVKKISGASQYLIKIPNGIAGVRGTQLGISASGDAECYESAGGGFVLSIIGPDGSPKTFLVRPGESFSPNGSSGGGGGVNPLPSGSLSNLAEIFNSLRTIYIHVVDWTYDNAYKCWISPTQGHGKGKGKGGGNGNGNGGGGGGGD